MGSNFRLCVIVSRDNPFLGNVATILETVLAETQKKKKKKCERKKGKRKKADKLLKCSTVNNHVRENSSDDGIEICYQDDTTSW